MTDRFEPKEESLQVDDYRAYFNDNILRVWHLKGRDRIYQITRVTRITTEVIDKGKRKIVMQPKLILVDERGRELLPFLLNKVNSKTIAQLYSKRPSQWVGKWITLYPTMTEIAGEPTECIRIRNQVPGMDRPHRTNKQGANVLPPPVPDSTPAPLDHDRARRNEDDDSLDAEYEVVQ